MRRIMEDFRRLREDVLPALRLVKDAQQPLPNLSGGIHQSYGYEATLSPPAPTPSTASSSGGLGSGGINRQYSQRKILTSASQKTSSPTGTAHERSIAEQSIDPTNAAERAVISSAHLAAVNGSGQSTGGYPSPNMPSPTSPQTHMNSATLASRSYRGDVHMPRSAPSEPDYSYSNSRDRIATGPPRRRETPVPDTPSSSNSVEIFKSFRVSMEDPCHKVLPAVLRKYQINAPWDQYGLYIVYGDQERCLGLDEKPLILFKQLEKDGRKPMFMLRKTNSAQADGEPGSAGIGTRGYETPGGII